MSSVSKCNVCESEVLEFVTQVFTELYQTDHNTPITLPQCVFVWGDLFEKGKQSVKFDALYVPFNLSLILRGFFSPQIHDSKHRLAVKTSILHSLAGNSSLGRPDPAEPNHVAELATSNLASHDKNRLPRSCREPLQFLWVYQEVRCFVADFIGTVVADFIGTVLSECKVPVGAAVPDAV